MPKAHAYDDWKTAYAEDAAARNGVATKAPGRPELEYSDRYLTEPVEA